MYPCSHGLLGFDADAVLEDAEVVLADTDIVFVDADVMLVDADGVPMDAEVVLVVGLSRVFIQSRTRRQALMCLHVLVAECRAAHSFEFSPDRSSILAHS